MRLAGKKNEKFVSLSLVDYLKVPFLTLLFIFLTTAAWSYALGQHLLYGFDKIIHDRLWLLILMRYPTGSQFITDLRQVPGVMINAFEVISLAPKLHTGPHEASFLNDLSFFNRIESVLLLLGLYAFVRGIFKRRLVNGLLLFLFGFFLFQLFSHPVNYLTVSRTTYTFYFVLVFFVAFGLAKIKSFSTVILLILLLINIKIFNQSFVKEFDESLQGFSGLYVLRQLYHNEISQGKNLFVYDYNLFHNGFEHHIDLISHLQGEVDYEVARNFFSPNFIDSRKSFEEFLNQGYYENVYFLEPVVIPQVGRQLRGPVEGFHAHDRKYGEWFSSYDPYLTTKNRRGSPTFFVYKFAPDYSYHTTEVVSGKNDYQFIFEEPQKIKFIDFPGGLKKVTLDIGGDQPLVLDLGRFSYDRFHLSFDDQSIITIYNNFNYPLELSNIVESTAKLSHTGKDMWGRARVDLFDPVGHESRVLFKYEVGWPISRVQLVIPFVFYNDQMMMSEFTVLTRTSEAQDWQELVSRRSNRSLRLSDYNFFVMPGPDYGLTYNTNDNYAFFRVLDFGGQTEQFWLEYRLSAFMPPAVRPYSSTYFPEESFNFLEIEVDTSEYQVFREIKTNTVKISLEFREEQKERQHNLISLGTD